VLGTVAVLLLPGGAAANEIPGESTLPPELSAASPDPEVAALWVEGLELERREDLLASSRRYEAIAQELPESPFIHWRISRNYWRHAERLPLTARRERIEHFEIADDWATRSLELDPDCGECTLWKLASMGRLATTAGVLEAMHLASTIANLIERGIELNPAHNDGRANVTLANLYYAGAAFYRIVPDRFWARWVIGVQGDKRRSLEYIRKALAISDPRVDYQVELGAVLLCIGHEKRDPQRVEEGRRALREAMEIPHLQGTDPLDIEHARTLMAEPQRACSYSRDGWLEASADRSLRAAAGGGSQGLR
jgi:tetratricopeptide (TPR) repeat protein